MHREPPHGQQVIIHDSKIQECLNRGKKVCGIFNHISKAFDKVWQSGLFYKLIYFGVPKYIIRFIKKF